MDDDTGGATTPISGVILDRLLSAAKYHVVAAREQANSASPFGKLDASIHAGAAVELLAKVLLARIDHRLLRDRQDVQHALLDLIADRAQIVGFEPRPIQASFRTLEAGVALDLACRISVAVRQHKNGAGRALKARNAAAHMAEFDPYLDRTLDETELFAAAALEVMGQDAAGSLGLNHLEQIQADYAERQRVFEETTRTKIEAAGATYRALVEDLPPDKRSQLSAILGSRQVHPGDDGWTIECPACQCDDAWLSLEVDYDYDHEGGFPVGMVPSGLDCPRCRLSLDAYEVDAAGIDTDDPREQDYDEDYRYE